MNKYHAFINITKRLNQIDIIPLLMGSVGLEKVTGMDWRSEDLDIHVPGDPRGWDVDPEVSIDQWRNIKSLMNNMGYTLTDLHEHAFAKGMLHVEFGIMDTLPAFCGVQLTDLTQYHEEEAVFHLLNPAQYLAVYESSFQDSYRAQQNNHKDINKIHYLRKMVFEY